MGPWCQGKDGEEASASVGGHGQAAVSCTTDGGHRGHWTRPRQPPHLCCAPPQLSRAFISSIDCAAPAGYYHSSTPADYCMTGAGHRLLSPFTLNPAY